MRKVCVCVWPWKLIKNRCSDNRIKVMEALCARVAYVVCVRACVCATVRQWLSIVDHNSPGALRGPSITTIHRGGGGVRIDLWGLQTSVSANML